MAALATAARRSVERGTTARGRERLAGPHRRDDRRRARSAHPAWSIEAVPEDLELKVAMLTKIEAVLADDAWLASNTSSLSIDLLAAAPRPAPNASAGCTSSTRCRARRWSRS